MVYIVNLTRVRQAYELWTHMFPTIRPFYAVKCCPDPLVVQTLYDCGSAFDCASPAEVNLVLDQVQATTQDIIYANPCKRPDDIQSVYGRGVRRTTFDSVCEIQKIFHSRELWLHPKLTLFCLEQLDLRQIPFLLPVHDKPCKSQTGN